MSNVVGRIGIFAAAVFGAGCCLQPVGPADAGTSSGGTNSGSGGAASSTTSGSTSGAGGTSGGGGSSGTGSTSGSAGGSTSGTTSGMPTQAQLCNWIWQGSARLEYLLVDSFAGSKLRPPTGPYCPTPTASQANAIGFVNGYLAQQIQTLGAPDGGWPDGSGPTVCDDPTSGQSQLAAAIEASLAAGRAVWNGDDAATCAQGMQQSQYLFLAVGSDGGFPGDVDVGMPDGGPCFQILEGQVAQGGGCTFGWDCASGLYCRPGGATSCAGVCAVPVADGQPCGIYDQCVSGDSCTSGTCTASGNGSGGSGTGAPGAPCTSSSDCQGCLSCSFGQNGGVCTALGLVNSACASDSDCVAPLLYCKSGSCQPAGVTGETGCVPGSDNACLFGWCEPTAGGSGACVDSSGLGGPCLDASSCSSGICSGADPDAGTLGSCASAPGKGQPCGAADGFACGSNLYCDTGSGSCQPTLPAGAACANALACQSLSCVEGQCASPCVAGCASGCNDGPGASLLLGLGGAAAIERRRRRRRR